MAFFWGGFFPTSVSRFLQIAYTRLRHYATHILLVPKRKYRSLLDIPSDDIEFMRDLFSVVQDLVTKLGLDESGYRLIVNGGNAQDIQHLHFHLISDVSLEK